MTQQTSDTKPAGKYLAQRILERLDQEDTLAVALRAALADPDGARLDALEERGEQEKERFFTLLQPLLEADPVLKDAYYGSGTAPHLVDASHHATLLRLGSNSLAILEHVTDLPPSDVEIEHQGKAIAHATANQGGMIAEGLLRQLPELAAHYQDAEAAMHDLHRAGCGGGQADQALAALERNLTSLRGAIARETARLSAATNLSALRGAGRMGRPCPSPSSTPTLPQPGKGRRGSGKWNAPRRAMNEREYPMSQRADFPLSPESRALLQQIGELLGPRNATSAALWAASRAAPLTRRHLAAALMRLSQRLDLAAVSLPTPVDGAPCGVSASAPPNHRPLRLARLSEDQQSMLYDLAAGATRDELVAGYCLSICTTDYHIRRIRFLLELEEATAGQFRLELRHYARSLPPLCDR